MSPGDEKGRPRTEGGLTDEQAGGRVVGASVRHPYVMAVEMLADSADRERALFEAAWAAGYRTGFETGAEVGFDRAHADIRRAWMDLAAKVRRLGTTPSQAELEFRRWGGCREDFGKPRPGDHLGGPVDYQTGRPLRGRESAA